MVERLGVAVVVKGIGGEVTARVGAVVGGVAEDDAFATRAASGMER